MMAESRRIYLCVCTPFTTSCYFHTLSNTIVNLWLQFVLTTVLNIVSSIASKKQDDDWKDDDYP